MFFPSFQSSSIIAERFLFSNIQETLDINECTLVKEKVIQQRKQR